MKQPSVNVGILFEPTFVFQLKGDFKAIADGQSIEDAAAVCQEKQEVKLQEGKILWRGALYDELFFEPLDQDHCSFELFDVTIGINFHWQRKEDQRFQGALKVIVDEDHLTAIDVVRIEDYLTSVISSEMSASASLELLKAHAVISRSWLLAQMQKNKAINQSQAVYTASTQTKDELIRWYDREDHHLFDVCADDHCQRYQGITRASTSLVRTAIAETFGQVLMSDNEICDARFSKSCGGALEEFQYCWEDKPYSYLKAKRDSLSATTLPDLRIEEEADRWIRTAPASFCNTTDTKILSQVLNNYDQETTDFYRWKVSYTQAELSALILKRSGIDFGDIVDLVPVQRGTSARLVKLKIIGTKRTMIIGKELEIRRTLSTSHLYSSAFVVDKSYAKDSATLPVRFDLIGAGWGHGVGLCQIGAAVMGEQGYAYDKILLHYYVDASISTLYTEK